MDFSSEESSFSDSFYSFESNQSTSGCIDLKERRRINAQNHRDKAKHNFNTLENDIHRQENEIFDLYSMTNDFLKLADNIDNNCFNSAFAVFNF